MYLRISELILGCELTYLPIVGHGVVVVVIGLHKHIFFFEVHVFK